MKNLLSVLFFLGMSLPVFADGHPNWSFNEFSLTPVQSGGRVKPMDSYARELVLFETGSSRFQGWKPVDLILSWISNPQRWETEKFIQITREDVRRQLGLDEKRTLFSPQELYQNTNLAQYSERMGGSVPGSEPPGAPKMGERDKELKAVLDRVGLFHGIVTGQSWLIVPKPVPSAWASLIDRDHEGELIRGHFAELIKAYQSDQAEEFDRRSRLLRAAIEGEIPGFSDHLAQALQTESLYNRSRPFLFAWGFYLIASFIWMIATQVQSATSQRRVKRAALFFTVLAASSQVAGITMRCFVAGRPPVTNMYESVIWVSLGVVIFASILYGMHRQAVIMAVASLLAMLGLIAGDAAPAILDPSIHPLVPVLRSNYWLTVHVLTITLGYAAFALTLGLANVSLFQFLRQGSQKSAKVNSLNQLTYRAMQFGVVLIAAGTILGGIWADYSWGRFWGWDPKEVWALITLLAYLIILHGRYANWVGQFGFAAWSAISFMTVVMAWYGVNFILGAGLHSYGFSTGGTPWVMGFVALQLLYVLAVSAIHYKKTKLGS